MKLATKLLFLCSLITACASAQTYVSGAIGHLVDSEEALYSTAFGVNLKKTGDLTHSLEAELLASWMKEGGLSCDVVPVMANYKLTLDYPGKLFMSLKAGIGFTAMSIKYMWYNEHDVTFTYQFKGEVGYRFTDKFAATLGARYIDLGDVDIASYRVDVGSDTAIELGVRWTF